MPARLGALWRDQISSKETKWREVGESVRPLVGTFSIQLFLASEQHRAVHDEWGVIEDRTSVRSEWTGQSKSFFLPSSPAEKLPVAEIQTFVGRDLEGKFDGSKVGQELSVGNRYYELPPANGTPLLFCGWHKAESQVVGPSGSSNIGSREK